MGNFSNYWDLTTLFTKIKNKLKSISDKIDDSVSLKTATGNPIILTDAANANAEELSMTIEPVQSGSGDPSPTNVRPISGISEAVVTRTGKNLFGNLELNKSISQATGEDIDDPSGFRTAGKIRTDGYNAITLTFLGSEYKGSFIVLQYSDSGYIGVVAEIQCTSILYPYNRTLTLNPETTYIRIKGWYGTNISLINTAQFQVILGSTPTAYEPYTATNATITFGQTVYGGSVNFKTGEVTVTHGMADLGALNWSYNPNGPGFSSETLTDIKKGLCDLVCSALSFYPESFIWGDTDIPDKSIAKTASNKVLYVKDTDYTDAATFKTAMSGVQLCYELATPTTLTLTPAELELLKGNNTITANGAEISIEYYPDNAIGTLAGRVDDVQEQIATKANTADVNTALATKANQTTVTIPRFITSQAGWRRICKIKPVDLQTVEGMIYVGGFWSNGQQPSATVAVSIMNSTASLTLLSSAFLGTKRITAMRLVADTEIEFWLDVYFPAYSSLPGPFKLKFTGDIAVSDIQDPISITTDATAASDEISLDQKVSGTVLTDKSSMIADLVSGKTDRFVGSASSTSQTIDVGAETTSNRMFLLSAGYTAQNGDYYAFGLIFIDYIGNIKYVPLKDTQITVSVTYADGIVSLTFSNHPYSKAVLIRLS